MARDEIRWTGKNLADLKRFHKGVAHYPEEDGESYPRDASQHPDNLHVDADGRTLVLGIGDTLSRDDEGRLSVAKGDTAPRKLDARKATGRAQSAEGSDTIRGKGGTR